MWIITHIPTGRCINIYALYSEKEARKYLNRLNTLFHIIFYLFGNITTAEFSSNFPRFRRKIKRWPVSLWDYKRTYVHARHSRMFSFLDSHDQMLTILTKVGVFEDTDILTLNKSEFLIHRIN